MRIKKITHMYNNCKCTGVCVKKPSRVTQQSPQPMKSIETAPGQNSQINSTLKFKINNQWK